MVTPESGKENASVLFFVDHYYCPDSKLNPPLCYGREAGDGGVAIVDATGSSMKNYADAFQLAQKHAPNCRECGKKTIPQVTSQLYKQN